MHMKKIAYLLLPVLAVFAFVSCDDLLDAFPKDSMAPETFFKNDKELQAFSMNFYGMFPGSSLYMEDADTYIQMGLTDELKGTRQIEPSGNGWSWGALRNVNTLLDYLPNCSDPAARIKYEALARFFRAYFYFEKVKRFGDVPWYDKPVGSADTEALNRPRDSREFILGKMIEDIDFAIANLPSTKSAYEVTKWTAMALKSRFLLFEGTFRKYHTEFDYGSGAHDAKWYLDLCAETSAEFIATSGYGIHTAGGANKAYYNLFTTQNASDNTDEVILARDYNASLSVVHSANNMMQSATLGRHGMTRKLVASYLMSDGSRFTDQPEWEMMDFVSETQNRDPRLAQTIRTPGYTRLNDKNKTPCAPNFLFCMTGYHPIKYVMEADKDTYNGSDVDLIIFRAAEVMLNYAEAKAEAGTLTQGDLDISINKIRDRVGLPHLDMAAANADPDPFLTDPAWGGYQNVTGADKGVILEIRRERAVELAQEGFRYYDIMRWKEGKIFEKQYYGMYFPGPGEYDLNADGVPDILLYDGEEPASTIAAKYKIGSSDFILSDGASGNVNPYKGLSCKWNDDRDYLYPIPTDERNLTKGALTQNPGWNDGLTF